MSDLISASHASSLPCTVSCDKGREREKNTEVPVLLKSKILLSATILLFKVCHKSISEIAV